MQIESERDDPLWTSISGCLDCQNTRRCRWRKSHSKIKANDEFGLAIPREGSERACLDCIGKSSENQIWESQNVPLSSLNVQQSSTGRLVLGAGSPNYSEWNIDEKWSSQVWKSGEMSNTSTGRPVYDKFVIDDDMNPDTATESNPSPRSRSFLNRVNDRLRKMLDQKMQCKTSTNVLWFGECLCLRHWKHLYSWENITQTIYISAKIQRIISQWNRCSTYLKNW